MKNRGFTLIEILAVMGVFVSVAGLIVSVLYISLRGSKKSDVMVVARQNGDVAMMQMTRMIRYARSLDSPASCVPSSTLSSITITSLDEGQTVFSCPVAPGEGIASNSASLVDTTAVAVSNCSFVCSQPGIVDPPSITIKFTLSAVGGGGFFEGNATIPFETSVVLRNWGN